jgi:hypothetical protein
MSEAEARTTTGRVTLRITGARLGEVALATDRQGRYLLPKGVRVTVTPVRGKVTVKTTGRRGKSSVDFKIQGAASYGTSAVAGRLVDLLGNNAVAELLGVAKDRPGRWVRGEGVEAANRAALADLESLVGQLLAAFTPAQAALWLTGDNAHLGARPIDAFRLHGSGPVVEAIAAREQGAFA